MSFGGGGGFGGGGAGERDEFQFRWFGPKGSGAFITPGEEWPTLESTSRYIIKKKGIWVVLAVIALLALSGDSN